MTSVFNLSIDGENYGRIFVSIGANSMITVHVAYPHDREARFRHSDPDQVADELKKYLSAKFSDNTVEVTEAKEAEVRDYERKFRSVKDDILNQLGRSD
jgi:hypothetical protein